MTTDPILQLVYGTRTLNLNDNSRYALEPGFTPPAALLSVQMSDGTSANRTGGATKIGQRAQNRQWSFSVQCLGSSERDVTRAFQDLAAFLAYAGLDRSVPLYLEYKPNSDINVKPLWGQDGWLRYEVRHANPPQIGERYGSTDFRARNVTALISIEVAPYAEGLQQRLCTAAGGIIEDTIGTVDGISRGLIVAEATCNLFTNPVFGNSTWNTGWTAAASLLAASSIDSRYLLPGTTVSAKLVASASTANTFLQDVTLSASQHAIWSVIKLPDGGTPASTMMQMAYNGSTLTTEFTSAGNGLWYAVASAIGTAGSASAGVVVKNGYTIYLMAVQAEKKTYRTPLCWGDLLGCTWTSTAHASTSTRTVASAKMLANDLGLSGGVGSISTTIKIPGSSFYSSAFTLWNWHNGATNYLWAYYLSGSFVIAYYNGTFFTSLGAVTLSAGGTYQIDVTWDGSAGLRIFVNGAQIGSTQTDKSFVALNGGTLYIGNFNGSANCANCTITKLVIYDRALTATQIANSYANQAQLMADGQRIESMPWLWTKDGDDVVDQYSDATHNHWAVAAGIPGSQPTEPEFYIGLDTTASGNFDADGGQYNLAVLDVDNLILPGNAAEYADVSGTVTTAADVGGEVQVLSTTSGAGSIGTAPGVTLSNPDNWLGREVFVCIRLSDAGSNLQMSATVIFGTNTMASDLVPLTADATRRLYLLGPVFVPDPKSIFNARTFTSNLTVATRRTRSSGSTANVSFDYVFIVPSTLIQVKAKTATASITGVSSHLRGYLATINDTNDKFNHHPTTKGAIITFAPDKINLLFAWRGAHGAAHDITRTMTFNKVIVTPRWGLL